MDRIALIILSFAFFLSSYGCHAGEMETSKQVRGTNEGYAELIDLAEEKGSIRVILHLIVPEIQELSAKAARLKDPQEITEADRKIKEIITAKADMVIDLITGTDFRIIHRYETLPLLAITASPEAIKKLAHSKDISSIILDKSIPLN